MPLLMPLLTRKKESFEKSSPVGGGHGTRTEIDVAKTIEMKGGKPLRHSSVLKKVLKMSKTGTH